MRESGNVFFLCTAVKLIYFGPGANTRFTFVSAAAASSSNSIIIVAKVSTRFSRLRRSPGLEAHGNYNYNIDVNIADTGREKKKLLLASLCGVCAYWASGDHTREATSCD